MKKLMGFFVALVAVVVMPTVVDAANVMPEAINGRITLGEDVTLTEAFVVKKGESVTLDLGNYTLTTAESLKAHTIYVELGGSLTINGSGTVKNPNYGYAPVLNNGTTVIKGGNFIDEKSGSDSDPLEQRNYYIILNHGDMTIRGGNFKTSGTFSSLIENGYFDFSKASNEKEAYFEGVNQEYPKLVIVNGTFDGGKNTVKNDDNGILTINDGEFKNTFQVPLLNWNEATVNGGTFEAPTGSDMSCIAVGSNGADSVDKGILKINGGIFNAEHVIKSLQGKPVYTKVEITSGTFNNTGSFLNETGLNQTLQDNVEIVGYVIAPASALQYAKEGAIVDLNSEVNVGDVLPVAEDVEVILPDGQVLVSNGDGTATVKESVDTTGYVKVVEKLNALNQEEYTEESLKKVETIWQDVHEEMDKMDLSKEEQAKYDELVKKLDDSLKLLVKKTDADKKPDATKNPNTGDNIITYVALGLVSLTAIGLVVKFKKFD